MNKLQSCIVVAKPDDVTVFANAIEKAFERGDFHKTIKQYVAEGGLYYLSTNEAAPPQLDLRSDLLIVEDEWEYFFTIIEEATKCLGIKNVVVATSRDAADYLLDSNWPAPSVITLDYKLVDVFHKNMQLDLSAIFKYTQDLYEKIKSFWPLSVVIGVTGWEIDERGSPVPAAEPLVTLMRQAGDDVFNKGSDFIPFIPHLLRNSLSLYRLRHEKQVAEEAAERAREAAEGQEYLLNYYNPPKSSELPESSPVPYIIGKSMPMRYLYFFMGRFAGHRIVNILGETGTGKELVARALHDMSDRAHRPFQILDCGKLVDSQVLESELFGHEKGAFTGADRPKKGLFELADGGTIFIDEIGEIGESFQLKLLGVLERGEYTRVGGTRPVKINVNVITATNKDLDELRAKRKFREDLYFRLSAAFLKVPRLRERRGDIALLANHFLEGFSRRTGKSLKRFSEEALAQLSSHPWEGNVRELMNTIELTVSLTSDDAEIVESNMLMLKQSNQLKVGRPALLTTAITRAWDWLDAIEKGAQAAMLAGDFSHEGVGKRLISPESGKPVTGNRLSQVFREYQNEILTLCEHNQDEWPTARRLRGFPRK
jgi:transcriptional regulator with GAF, ATPase, and Fis domain